MTVRHGNAILGIFLARRSLAAFAQGVKKGKLDLKATSYEQNFQPSYFECDPEDRMTPGSVLRRVQEVSTDQCEEIGMTTDYYWRINAVFLLSRASLIMHKMPAVKQRVRIVTQPYGIRRAVYFRATTLYDEQGEVLCETDTRWVLVDITTRRILRTPLPDFAEYFADDPTRHEHPMQMPKPEHIEKISEQQAVLSLCDRNGHVNNTRYADIMCDLLPYGRIKDTPPRQMLLFYRNEIPMGSHFEMLSGPAEGGTYFLAQTNEGKKFEGLVLFGD